MYKLHPMFAAEHNLPVAITAVVLVETQKAVYLYGHGSLKVAATCGFCCRCGRTLTHPGSIVLGIGPECLGNWQMRDDVLKSLDADRVAELRRKIKVERKVDCWVPKKCLKDFGISEEDVPIPKEHPRLRRPDQTTSVTESGGLFTVRFPYDPAKVAYIKTVPGRRWDPNNKCWTVPANAISAEMLREVGFTVPQADAQSVEAGRGVGSLEGFGKTLMPFQMEGFKAIYRFGGRVLIGDDMGLGKTIQALAYIYAQKKERPVLVICPTTMKPVWAAEVRSTCPGVSYNLVSGRKREALPKADIHIIGYDVVAARLGDLLGAKFQVLVLDECFPAGTRISTPFGEKEIQTLQTGDLVINAAGVGVIKNIDAHYVPISSIVRLHLSNGEKIRCTSEHPFFTEHGWVSAIDLQGKKVFTHSQICTIMSSNTNGKKGGHYGKSLRVLWQGFSNSQREQPKTKILRDILRSEMEDETACRAQKNAEALGRQGKVIFNNEKNAPRKSACATDLFKKYEREQPNKKTRSHRKNKKTLGAIWAPIIQAADKRREWPPTPCCSTGFVRSIGKWLGTRIPYPHKKKKPFSNQLQSGFSIPRKKNMDRSRWLGTSVTRGENEGQKKRIYPSFIRVERVEVYQPKNNGGTSLSARGSEKVYNLEVSGHPSFFAEGFLVHNCHFLKNRSAQRTKAVLGVGKKATGLSSIPTIIALSGTPFLSRPVEIFPVIKALAPNKIPPFMTFAHQYCGATHNGFGWDFNGCSNAEELFQLLISAVMIRRTKTEVLKDLPDKTRTVIPLEMEKKARQEYKKANQHFLGWLKSVNPDKLTAAMRAEALVQFQELKKLARRGKWAAAMEWLQDTLESCDKVIIFGTHHETVDLLMEALKTRNPVKLDGRSSPKAKEDAVRRFQEDPTCKVFIGNVKAAGVGLTLTAASTVAFMELGWTPGEHNQAEDRAHRIGQKKAVNIYYLLAEDTIEMQIAALLDRKRRVLDAVLDGKETESAALLVELLHKYMQEQR
jgi:hypothetical protein